MVDDYLDGNNEPNYDAILSGITYPTKLDPGILGHRQYTDQLFEITDRLQAQGYDRDFIAKVVIESHIRFNRSCGLPPKPQTDQSDAKMTSKDLAET